MARTNDAHISTDRMNKVAEVVHRLGYELAGKELGLKKETVRRYMRQWKQKGDLAKDPIDENLAKQLRERFSDAELKQILNGSQVKPDSATVAHDFSGDTVTLGCLTDTHLGSKYSDPAHLQEAFEIFAKEDVDFITHSGDIHEGLSHRPGHMYECTHLGYSAQLDYSREVFGQWTQTPVYMIDGNHDRWFIKSNGALIGEELCRGQENLHFIGHDEGDIDIQGVKIKLWHGLDGNSYAYSYRIQKIVESLTGGEKPNVLICGHTHKALYAFDRNIHCVSAGSMQKQSKWMRGKRAASHTGFYVVKMGINDLGVSWFEPRFYPFYQ